MCGPLNLSSFHEDAGRFDPIGFISHRTKLEEINETMRKCERARLFTR